MCINHADERLILCSAIAMAKDFTPYTRCKAVMSLWAGVETVVDNKTLTQPLLRMVDHGLTQGMVEWVVGHAMRHHLGMDAHIHGQDGVWRNDIYPPMASARPVTILGLGALGTACGQALQALGFPVTGWSRNAKNVAGIRCLHGAEGFEVALDGAQIVILLLPDTPATENALDAKALSHLAPGAFIINPGRGPLIDGCFSHRTFAKRSPFLGTSQSDSHPPYRLNHAPRNSGRGDHSTDQARRGGQTLPPYGQPRRGLLTHLFPLSLPQNTSAGGTIRATHATANKVGNVSHTKHIMLNIR